MTDAPLQLWLHATTGIVSYGGTPERYWECNEYVRNDREALAQSPIVQAMIKEAVEAEREACADVVEDFNEDIWDYSTGNRAKYGTDPAANAIRRRG